MRYVCDLLSLYTVGCREASSCPNLIPFDDFGTSSNHLIFLQEKSGSQLINIVDFRTPPYHLIFLELNKGNLAKKSGSQLIYIVDFGTSSCKSPDFLDNWETTYQKRPAVS